MPADLIFVGISLFVLGIFTRELNKKPKAKKPEEELGKNLKTIILEAIKEGKKD